MSVTSVGLSTPGGFLLVNNAASATITTSGIFALTLGTLPIVNGGTGQTTATGTGAVVLRTAPTFLTDLSTPQIKGSGASGDLLITSTGTISLSATNFITLGANTFPATVGTSGNILGTNGLGSVTWQTPSVASVTGVLPVANGGTGSSTAATGTGAVVLRTAPTFLTSITTPRIIGSGTSNDLDIASARNITLTGGLDNAIFLNTALYARDKIVGDTGGDFIIENPSSFIFLNPGYSVRTGGIALHVESANNQTFTGTVIGDQTIRTDSNCWIGPGVGGAKLQLIGPSGVFANGARIDRKTGVGLCTILTTNVSTTTVGSLNLSQNTTNEASLTLVSGALLQNNLGFDVLVSLYYSAQRSSNGFGVDQFWVEKNTSSARYCFLETSALVRQSGTAIVPLLNGESLSVKWYQNSGASLTCSTGTTDIVNYTVEQFF